MLQILDIKNVALIEELNIDMECGMTVLTGETGAGKSIIIDCVNMLLGARTNKSLVRYGTEKACVQGVFTACSDAVKILTEQGIDAEDDSLVIRREVTADGKSVCRINGVIVPLNVLREVGAYLINIHGQQDNQALLNSAKHMGFLDEYAKTDLSEYVKIYEKRKGIIKEIESLSKDEQERLSRIDFLSFQVKEIEDASLKTGEKEELTERRELIENSEKIISALNEAYSVLYDENSAYDAISTAEDALSSVSGIDDGIDGIISRITDTKYVIEDCVHELKGFLSGMDFDASELDFICERLDLIHRLERKYGGDVDSVLKYYEEASAELSALSNADERIELLQIELEKAEKEIKTEGKKVTEQRQKAAKKLQSEIEAALRDLDMPKVKFEAVLTPCGEYTAQGAETAGFMICPNEGEQMKPLAETASGGELSRVMLAIRSIIADNVDTLIFDEIDTGVSGRAVRKIAKKLSGISEKRQVICVSHQPQLAAVSDNHLYVEKHAEGGRTVTNIRKLTGDERVMEIARIIDGDNITETAINHAKEMMNS